MEINTGETIEIIYSFPKYCMHGARGIRKAKPCKWRIPWSIFELDLFRRQRFRKNSLYKSTFACTQINFIQTPFSLFHWKITERGFTAENVRKVLLLALKDLFKNFVSKIDFALNAYIQIEFGPFHEREPSSFFLNYLKILLVVFCGFHGNPWHCVKVVVLFGSI